MMMLLLLSVYHGPDLDSEIEEGQEYELEFNYWT